MAATAPACEAPCETCGGLLYTPRLYTPRAAMVASHVSRANGMRAAIAVSHVFRFGESNKHARFHRLFLFFREIIARGS